MKYNYKPKKQTYGKKIYFGNLNGEEFFIKPGPGDSLLKVGKGREADLFCNQHGVGQIPTQKKHHSFLVKVDFRLMVAEDPVFIAVSRNRF